jgi:uncharacterized protein (TIGR00255 family)
MIASMTGYGQHQLERDGVKLAVEIRSVNSRFLDIQVRLPRFLQSLEAKVKELIQEVIHRGKINLSLVWEAADDERIRFGLDPGAARTVYELLVELKDALGLTEEVRMNHLMTFSEIFKQEKQDCDLEEAWLLMKEAVQAALEDLQSARLQEGEQLHGDIAQRIHRLGEIVASIEGLHPQRVEQMRIVLQKKIAALLDSPEVDEQRLAMEVALLAEKTDITEECVRFRSHNKLFLAALESSAPVGRKLTFLLQEMNREANTMGSKASDAQVAHQVVEIKEEIERIREQVQNVE